MVKFAALLLSSVVAAGAAHAIPVVTSTPYGFAAPAGPGALVDFDTVNPAFTLTGSGYTLQKVSNSIGAAPALSATPGDVDTSFYLTVYGGTAKLLGAQAYTGVSLYWGSIDDYNALDLLDMAGNTIATINSSMIPSSGNGDQVASNTNRRVDITNSQAFYGLGFRSTGAAFEADNVKFSGAVPEPASWAMMIGGFGMIGGAMRASRRKVAVAFG